MYSESLVFIGLLMLCLWGASVTYIEDLVLAAKGNMHNKEPVYNTRMALWVGLGNVVIGLAHIVIYYLLPEPTYPVLLNAGISFGVATWVVVFTYRILKKEEQRKVAKLKAMLRGN